MKRRILAVGSVSVVVFIMATLLFALGRIPEAEAVRRAYRSSDLVILDRNEQIIDEVRANPRVRRLGWVRLNELPPAFLKAVLLAADKRFYYSPGVSPITLRVVDLIVPRAHRTMAFLIEMKWSKSSILEAYINLVYYRSQLQGVAAASYGIFDKAPSALTRAESAVLAALMGAPNEKLANVRGRACELLRQMGSAHECGLLTLRHLTDVERAYEIRPFMRMAPNVARHLAKMNPRDKSTYIRSTLDRGVQWAALHSLQNSRIQDGAVVVIENGTGDVLAYVGNRRPASVRHAGATLMPFIYAKAIDERILTAASALENAPLALRWATAREALAGSFNIPAMRTLEVLGVDNFVQTMAELGFTGMQRHDFYGPSLAVGGVEVCLVELANAYRTLANGGTWSPIRFSPDETSDMTARPVFSADTAFIIGDILADRETPGMWTAVKSGSSIDMRENLSVGFSEKYTVAVWTASLSGVQGASPVWREVMNHLHKRESSQPPRPPPTLHRAAGAHGEEWFLPGTEGTLAAGSRFSYPVDQSIVPLGADIRAQNQAFIQIVAPQSDQNVYLNGRRLGRARPFFPWRPRAGQFVLELKNAKGQTIDRVSFEVRARNFASAP